MLTYKNDPLLLGTETVNDLIKDKKQGFLFLDEKKKILNLYSAFIKKSDFIKKDKIVQPLQKTVYVKISSSLGEILLAKFQNLLELKKKIEAYMQRRS
jgi:proteasome assembly chaperone (PAC2) family protein